MKNLGLNERETIYKEYSSSRWNYWTYVDGIRYSIGKKEYEKIENQGAKTVLVR